MVAGAGSGYDALAIAKHPNVERVTTVDIAPTAVARMRSLAERAQATNLSAEQADFFAFTGIDGRFDSAWDYTFYCAIQPEQRDAWCTKMAQLLRRDAHLVSLIFPVVPDADPEQGPPFPLDPSKVQTRLESHGFRAVSVAQFLGGLDGRSEKEWLGCFTNESPR